MKIETSMKITGLPRGGWIKAVGAGIEFDLGQDEYSIAEVIEIRDALTKVIEYALFGAPELAAEQPEPGIARVFIVGDTGQSDLRKVTDRFRDIWIRCSNGEWEEEDSRRRLPWQDLLRAYSPLTEVIEQ